MNLTKGQKIRLGVFVISGSLLFVAAIVTITGLRLWEPRDLYTVRFTENVAGLEPSSAVKYQGLRVGRVEKMRVAPDDPSAIEITLAFEPGTVLYEGTRAYLDTSGLTGLKSVNLNAGDPRSGKLQPGTLIPTDASFVNRLTGRAEEISLKVELVANQLARWTRDENMVRTEKLIDAFTDLSKTLDKFLSTNRDAFKAAMLGLDKAGHAMADMSGAGTASLNTLTQEATRTMDEARTTLRQWRRPVEGIDPKDVTATLDAARRAMHTVDKRLSSRQLNEALDNLNVAFKDLTRLLQDMDLAVRSGREDFTAALSYLRQAAEDMREFSRIIAQDPAAILRGRE